MFDFHPFQMSRRFFQAGFGPILGRCSKGYGQRGTNEQCRFIHIQSFPFLLNLNLNSHCDLRYSQQSKISLLREAEDSLRNYASTVLKLPTVFASAAEGGVYAASSQKQTRGLASAPLFRLPPSVPPSS